MPVVLDPRTGEYHKVNNQVIPRRNNLASDSNIDGNIALLGGALLKGLKFLTRNGKKKDTESKKPSVQTPTIEQHHDSILSPEIERMLSAAPDDIPLEFTHLEEDLQQVTHANKYLNKKDYTKIPGR
jgi:hypothetical protein